MAGLLAEAANRSKQLERQLFTNPCTQADSRLPALNWPFALVNLTVLPEIA